MKLANTIKIISSMCLIKIIFLTGLFINANTSTETSPIEISHTITTFIAPIHSPAVAFAKEPIASKPVEENALLEQQKQLNIREQELNTKQRELQALEVTLNKKLQDIENSQKTLENLLASLNTVQDKKVKHLIDVYANMKPQQAATVLQNIDENIAVQILSGMKGRKAGEILTFVEAKKAGILSEKLTKLQITDTK